MAKKKRRKRQTKPVKPTGEGLGTLTVRLSPALLSALRIAAVQQRNAGEEPWSQQGIVSEALEEWLDERGYGP